MGFHDTLNGEIGAKVISVSNSKDGDRVRVGIFSGWEEYTNGQMFPLVSFGDGVKMVCFSTLLPYSEEILAALSLMEDPLKYVWELSSLIQMVARKERKNE